MQPKNKYKTHDTLLHWQNFRLKLIGEGIIVGIICGLLIVLYRFLLEEAVILSRKIYHYQTENIWFIPVWMVILVIIGNILGFMISKDKMIRGSGIPQVEGVLLRHFNMNWWQVILGKFVGGILSIGSGLSLGREGPSVQIGAAVGQGISKILKRIKLEEKYLITSGASAGLSAAFNAPLAGVMFALEEVHKNFSPTIMTSAMAASLAANFVSSHFFGLSPLFDFHQISRLPLKHYLYLILLGVILGGFGVLFNRMLLITQNIYAKQKWLSIRYRPIVPLLVAGIVGLLFPEVLGGGHHLIVSLTEGNIALEILLALLIVKFAFTMISYGSDVPGGIFLPLLAIGALIGNIYGEIIIKVFNFNPDYINNLIIFSMAGYFTAIVKAPITGIILITEMTGSFSILLPVTIVCVTAYTISDVLGSKPIYESLLEKSLGHQEKNDSIRDGKNKLLLEIAVSLGSKLDGEKIRELNWPENSLIVAVKRGEKEIFPKPNMTIHAGDYLLILVDENHASYVKQALLQLAGKTLYTVKT